MGEGPATGGRTRRALAISFVVNRGEHECKFSYLKYIRQARERRKLFLSTRIDSSVKCFFESTLSSLFSEIPIAYFEVTYHDEESSSFHTLNAMNECLFLFFFGDVLVYLPFQLATDMVRWEWKPHLKQAK
ncbi:hypothetical protein OPV22_005485 [Ensete ventricosum]|uniref:Uncharacterized protein n=1 Tax=Ensete ventricosum TaxID=4639 RepID=A0AAV8RMM9_ENSVE|nr:hypothetical protein OPV22_005485 [Ensete ventricosum]